MEEALEIIKKLDYLALRLILKTFSKPSSGRVSMLRARVTRLASFHAVNNQNISIFDLLHDMNEDNKLYGMDSSSGSSRSKQKSAKRSRSSSGVDIVEIHRTPVHPDVKFQDLPFFDIIDELIKPTALKNNVRGMDQGHKFHLTPTQVSAIRKNVRGRGTKFMVQVQVRIGLLETTSLQEDNFPSGLVVKINGVESYAMAAPNTRGFPIDVTRCVVLDPAESNLVQISYLPTFQPYVVAVYLVRSCSWEDLLKKLKLKGRRVAFYTQGMIQQKLRTDLDNEIATTHLRVHLVCPLGKMRMSNPCRAMTCQHVQCFDASIYLQMNEKSSKWICPVCNKPALFDDLAIDEYFVKVLASDRLPSGCTEIQLMNDGGWQPAGLSNTAIKPSPSTSSRVSSVDVTSSDDECEVLEERAPAPVRRQRSPETVDLISSPSPEASSSSSPESPSPNLPPKKRKQVLECVDEIFLSSDSDHESLASQSTTSLSQSDSDDSERQISRRKQVLIPTRRRSLDSTHSVRTYRSHESIEEEEENPPEYAINLEKSSLTTLVLRKRPSGASEDGSNDASVQNPSLEISKSILDSIISSIVDKHASECFTKNDEPKMDKPVPKRPKTTEPFLPSILKRHKPVEQKKDTLLLPLVRQRVENKKPKRKNLSEVVKNLQPREPSPELQLQWKHNISEAIRHLQPREPSPDLLLQRNNTISEVVRHLQPNREPSPTSNFDSFLAGTSAPSPALSFGDFLSMGMNDRDFMSRSEMWANPYMPYNESENIVTSSVLRRDVHFPYVYDNSSPPRAYHEDWMAPPAFLRRDLPPPSYEQSFSPAQVAENRAEQSNSRLPAILRKSRERK